MLISFSLSALFLVPRGTGGKINQQGQVNIPGGLNKNSLEMKAKIHFSLTQAPTTEAPFKLLPT